MRFCFYSGYKDLKGGYTTLLLTLIKELHRQGHNVLLINYAGGLIELELKKDNVHIPIIDLATHRWDVTKKAITSEDIFIITKFDELFRHFFRVNPKVIFFDINDYITTISDYKFGIKLHTLGKRLINKLIAANSIVFMDDTGVYNLSKEFLIDIKEPVFVPIPVTVPDANVYVTTKPFLTKTLQATYVGRSVDWKMMPLKKVLDDISAARSSVHVHMKIVVDDLPAFDRYIHVSDYKNAGHLTIEVMENLPPSEVNALLRDFSEIHFAMGTAALDAGKQGIPTILVDYSTKQFPAGYKYKWLFETKDYSLGRNLDKVSPDDGISMQTLLDSIADKQQLLHFSSLNFNYTKTFHSAENVVHKLVEVSRSASFRFKDARHLVPYYFKAHTLIRSVARVFRGKGIDS